MMRLMRPTWRSQQYRRPRPVRLGGLLLRAGDDLEHVAGLDHSPVENFLLVALASVTICLLATIYPARQAAGLAPVEVIRYE